MDNIRIDFTGVNLIKPYPTLIDESVETSKALKHHILVEKPLSENVYKVGSQSFMDLLEEARDLFMNGEISLSNEDIAFIVKHEFGTIEETEFISDDLLNEAEYQGHKVQLGKIMQGDIKKFKVYVKNDKGKVVKVNFGFGGKSAHGKRMVIKKNNPERRKNFRARMRCDNPGPRWKARYWACRTW